MTSARLPRSCSRRGCPSRLRPSLDPARFGDSRKDGPTIFSCIPRKRPCGMRSRLGSTSCTSRKTPAGAIRRRSNGSMRPRSTAALGRFASAIRRGTRRPLVRWRWGGLWFREWGRSPPGRFWWGGGGTHVGALALVRFVIAEVVKPSGEKIRVDWHGHSDRGLAIANSMAAIIAGANCVHGCALGLGERVGNTQVDQMLVNLKLMGIAPWDEQNLTKLKQYCQAVSRATGVPIPANYPVVGDDAFRTATGVHASAIIKAYHKDDVVLANTDRKSVV